MSESAETVELAGKIAIRLREWLKPQPDKRILSDYEFTYPAGYFVLSLTSPLEGFNELLRLLSRTKRAEWTELKQMHGELLESVRTAEKQRRKYDRQRKVGLQSKSEQAPDEFFAVEKMRSYAASLAEVLEDLVRTEQARLKSTEEAATNGGAAGKNDAYIPYTKAIELSNGVLTRKKLDRAIRDEKPIKVRFKKPSKNRMNVHIQDVLSLIEKLSENHNAEEAARMFAEYVSSYRKKRGEQIDLS